MSFACVSDLKNLNQQFMRDANYHLNEARKKLKNQELSTKCSMNDFETCDMSLDANYYSKTPYRHQYNNWKSRNDSQQLSSNISWNAINTNRSGTCSITNTNKFDSFKGIHPVKKIKRLLVSGKTYEKDEPKNLPRTVCSSAPCKDCYCQNTSDLIKRDCTCAYIKDAYESDVFSDTSSLDSNEHYQTSDVNFSDNHNGKILQSIDTDELESLQQFRDRNYFECHSVEAKLNQQKNIKVAPHTCKHEFVINDRLFPEPVYSDHRKISRCRECHLPLEKNDNQTNKHADNNKKHMCKFANNYVKRSDLNKRVCVDSDYMESSSDSDEGRIVPEVNIKFPYRKELIIPQNSNYRSGSSAAKVESNFRFHPKSDTVQDSLALRYQPGFKHLSSDNSI